jgi:hypothetical protein
MSTLTNKPLALAFIIVVVVFLLFCGGAITLTMKSAGVNGNGMLSNFSWMWIPALLALLLSVLLGWTIFRKKE